MCNVASLLKQARKRCGMTQVQLAAAAGTRQTIVSRIEAGLAVPTLDMVARLAAALGCAALLRLSAGPKVWQVRLEVPRGVVTRHWDKKCKAYARDVFGAEVGPVARKAKKKVDK